AMVEDIGNTWAANYLRFHLDASSVVAAFGFVALIGGQLVGRATADKAIDKYGQRRVIRTGALIIAVGLSISIAVPWVPITIAGFAAAGFGAAPLIPAAYDRADRLAGLRPAAGLTLVAWAL